MTLKFLIDFYDGVIPKGFEHLETAIENIMSRVEALEQQIEKEEKIKTSTRLCPKK